eukprot:11941422-Karenia_brevis.AAC.1
MSSRLLSISPHTLVMLRTSFLPIANSGLAFSSYWHCHHEHQHDDNDNDDDDDDHEDNDDDDDDDGDDE